jgi:hypothetical protein
VAVGGVLTFVIGALAVIALLLAVPVDVAFRVKGIVAFEGQFGVRWLFGLVRYRLRVPDPDRRRGQPTTAQTDRSARRKRKAAGGRRHVLAVLRQAPFRRRVVRFVADLLRAAHLRELVLRVRLGLGDPADTGRLWALVGPLGAAAQSLRGADVSIEPDFIDPVLEFDARGRSLLVPLQILVLAVAFALSPVSLRAWRTLRSGDA